MNYLFWANIAIWTGIGGYSIILGLNYKKMKKRIKQLEMNIDE